MNGALWFPGARRAGFAIAAAVIVVLFFVWHTSTGEPFGSRDDRNTAFLLWTGWLAVLLFVALALYAVRRAAHRLRLSPEFAWKAKLPNLERAQSELRELQNRIVRREVVGAAAARTEATRIVKKNDVHRVVAVVIEPDPSAIGLLRVRTGPREPIGRLATWLGAHIWLGIAAAVLVVYHGGLRSGSTIGLLLNVLSFTVIGSGVLGAVLWTFGPTWLTRAERELTAEKAFALRAHYDRKIADCAKELRESTATAAGTGLRRDLAILTGQRELVVREHRRIGVWRELLRVWRFLHVPLSLLLLALVILHVVGVLRY